MGVQSCLLLVVFVKTIFLVSILGFSKTLEQKLLVQRTMKQQAQKYLHWKLMDRYENDTNHPEEIVNMEIF